jgi:hypothetical protein
MPLPSSACDSGSDEQESAGESSRDAEREIHRPESTGALGRKEANRMREQSKAEATERRNPQMSRWRVLAILLGPSLLLLVIVTGVASMIALLFR